MGSLLFDASVLRPVTYGLHLRVKDKVLNIWSILYAATILSVAALVLPLMVVTALFADITGNGRVTLCSAYSTCMHADDLWDDKLHVVILS